MGSGWGREGSERKWMRVKESLTLGLPGEILHKLSTRQHLTVHIQLSASSIVVEPVESANLLGRGRSGTTYRVMRWEYWEPKSRMRMESYAS